MIPAKLEPISIIPARTVESIIDWFEHNKRSFYILGLSYLRSQKQMEEVFYRCILKVHKELPRLKEDASFKMWVTSIFIQSCREVSRDESLQASEKSEPRPDLFTALDQLKESEREAVILTYIQQFSQEHAAYLLQVSEDELKKDLFSGIQKIKKELGYGRSSHGCKEYYQNYIDYFERTLDRPEKVDFEIHVYHCQNCQEDLAAFQDIIFLMVDFAEKAEDFHVPSNLLENVKARLAEMETQRHRKNKKRIKMGIVVASVLILIIGIEFFTGSFRNTYYAYAEKDQELRPFLQKGFGKMLNLKAENDGVRITIKSAVADDIQTLIFYEVEDKGGEHQYIIDSFEGVSVQNESEIMGFAAQSRYYPPDLTSGVNSKEKNVYQGKMSLRPIRHDNGIIKLRITKLLKLIPDPSSPFGVDFFRTTASETGEWSFEIPVTKKPSSEYELDEVTEIAGIPVRFDKLIIAPTTTVLQYAVSHEQPEKRLDSLNFGVMEVNNKKLKPDLYGSTYLDGHFDGNWAGLQQFFEPVLDEKPKEATIHFNSANLSIIDEKIIELTASQQYPHTFEYAGSTITIDMQEIGQSKKIVISNFETKNRAYEYLQIDFMDENGYGTGLTMDTEGIIVDKNGVEYDTNDPSISYEKLEMPRHFTTVQNIMADSQNGGGNEIPKRLVIRGYNTTRYLDDVVKLTLK
ncbi:DUF4179 domain-containing protein [Neobacillus notoginsengisoli]|uniref:DUF4179 domain-containing protein n=1 Tax=Neobacillus notoginsengisoli TaxID=1578198 RepID=A0A417Z061_9BACI|nr:DUF4179 domain-containing protein [Neobacillus notoginsengisoli]RHW43517.1 DUF4179 domain-containing protein [Neobacillus notoginsengisoli]